MSRKRCSLSRRLRETITLQSPTMPTDGTVEPTFTDEMTVRAEVVPKRGKESVNEREVEAHQTWVVTIRHPRQDIDPTWRVVWGSRTLNVVSAFDPDQMRRMMVIECTEARP